MKIVLTGGSGDLGMALSHYYSQYGVEIINLDLQPSPYPAGEKYIQGSILDREAPEEAFQGADMVIHIAGLHGIHLAQGKATEADFQSVNVDGTRTVFEAANAAGIEKVIHISTSDVHDEKPDAYGKSKIEAEIIAESFATDHSMKVISLRPRAFIPPWSESAYPDADTRFADWSKWFLKGAVHLQDVAQAVVKTVLCLEQNFFFHGQVIKPGSFEALDIDGTYECTEQDLEELQKLGFTQSPQHAPESWRKKTEELLGYSPTYGVREFIEDWNKYAPNTPPNRFCQN